MIYLQFHQQAHDAKQLKSPFAVPHKPKAHTHTRARVLRTRWEVLSSLTGDNTFTKLISWWTHPTVWSCFT